MRGTVFSKFGHRLLQYLPGLGCVSFTLVGSEVILVKELDILNTWHFLSFIYLLGKALEASGKVLPIAFKSGKAF